MGIYSRALGGQQQLEGQATGMLGLATPPSLPGRPPLPSTDVGNVDFEGAINTQRNSEAARAQQAQQEAISGLTALLQTGATGALSLGRGGGGSAPGGILQGTGGGGEQPYVGGYSDIYGASGGLRGVEGGIPLQQGVLGPGGIPLEPGPLTRFG